MADTTTRIYELQVKLAQDSLAQLKKLQSSTSAIEKQFDRLGGAVRNFGTGLIAAFSVQQVVSSVQAAITAVDELGAAAQRIGMGVEPFSGLVFAADQADASMAELEIGLKELQKSMVETSTKGAKVLDALKIDKTKPQIEVLKDFADAFKDISDPVLQTNALLEVFGKSGLKLRGLMEQGAEGITKATEEAAKFGAVITEDVSKALSDLDNEMKKTKATTDGMTRSFAGALAPALTDIMQGFRDATQGGSTFEMVGKALGVVLRGLAAGGLAVAQVFKQTGAVIHGVAAAAFRLLTGDIEGAQLELKGLDVRLKENAAQHEAAMKTTLGTAAAVEKETKATEANTTARGRNNAALRAALADADKEKKAVADKVTEFEKLTKALDDQLFALQQVESSFPAYEKAARRTAEAVAFLNFEQLAAAQSTLLMIAAQEKKNIADKKTADELKEFQEIIKSMRTDEEKVGDAVFRVQELIAKFPALAAEGEEAIRRMWEAYFKGIAEVKPPMEDANKLLEALADKVDGYAKSIADSLIDFASGARDAKFSFSDFATSVLRDLAKMATQIMLIEPLMKQFKEWVKTANTPSSSGSGGGFFAAIADGIVKMFSGGATANALGGIYKSASLSKFSGGVYDKPRVFAFAKGAGVFAESGPEAIMPLKRGADGALGVDTSGAGSIEINVYNESRAQVTTTARTDVNGKRVIELLVKEAVASGFRSGAFDGVMGSTYGLNRQGAR